MKINLAENMLRFGVKNLKKHDKEKLKQVIAEQNRNQAAIDAAMQGVVAANQRNTNAANARTAATQNQLNKSNNDVAQANITMKEGTDLAKQGFSIFSGTVQPGKPINFNVDIRSQFYNNMVSANGLMNSDMDDDIAATIKQIRDFRLTEVTVKLFGTATSATPGKAADNRYIRNGGKLTLAQDHGGTLYGGGEPSNAWLAQKRAETLKTKFEAACKEAGIKATITATSKVVPGTFGDDAKRVSRAEIVGIKPTLERVEIGNPTLTIKVRYAEKFMGTNQEKINQVAYGAKNLEFHCWQGSISIEFGNTNVPIGDSKQVIPGQTFKRYYVNSSDITSGNHGNAGQDTPGGWKKFQNPTNSGMILSAANAASDQAYLRNFLLSCGRFTKQQVEEILNDFAAGAKGQVKVGTGDAAKVTRSKILQAAWGTQPPLQKGKPNTDGEGGVWEGDLNKLAALYGGAPKTNPLLTMYGLNQDTMKLYKTGNA